jgi:carbonic anhydrase
MKNKVHFISLFAIAVLALGACAPQAETPQMTEPPHWTYEGAEGPEHWGELDEAFALCGIGKSQSPIDVTNASVEDLANLSFHYQPSEVNILNNGHTVQVNYDSGSYMELDGVRYDVLQFHHHAPSEHALNGKLYAAEFHIVHKNADGGLAVVGILVEEGAENPAFAAYINNLPVEKSDVKDAGVTIDVADFLPTIQTTYRYSGSLTTPPCSEGVKWNLLTTPIEMSAAQLTALENLFEHGNNRPVQPLLDRTLVEDNTP